MTRRVRDRHRLARRWTVRSQRHHARQRDGHTAFLVVDVEVRHRQRDRRARVVHRWRIGVRGWCLAAVGIGHGDANADLLGYAAHHQVAHLHIRNAVGQSASCRVLRHHTRVAMVVDCQCDSLAHIDGAGGGAMHRAGDGGGRVRHFQIVDDVVARDWVDRDLRRQRVQGRRGSHRGRCLASAGVGHHDTDTNLVDRRAVGQIAHQHIGNAVYQTRFALRHHTGVVVAVDGQRDGLAHIDRAGTGGCHRAGDGGRGGQYFLVVDDVVTRDRVNRDLCRQCVRTDSLTEGCAVSAARRVVPADRGSDGLTGQRAAQHANAVGSAIGVHGASANLRCAHHQRDRVAGVGVATHGAGNLHSSKLGVVDDVITGDRADRDGGASRIDAYRMGCLGAVGAAHVISAADCGSDSLPGHRAARHANAVAAVGGHGARADLRRTDHQYDGVTGMCASTHAAGNLHCLADFDIVDDVVGRDVVDRDRGAGGSHADQVGCTGAVGAAGRVLATDRCRHSMAGHRAARHVDAVVAVGVHGAGADHRTADGQGDRVACVGIAADVAGHRHLLTGFDVVDDVVPCHGVHRDGGAGTVGSDSVVGAGSVGVAHTVRTADRCGDQLAGHNAARHVDAVVAIGVHRACAEHRIANAQRDRVAGVGVAAYTAGHLYRLVSLDVVDDVVGRDVVDCDGGAGCVRSDRMCCVGAVGAAGCVLAADRGGDGLTGHGAARHVDAVVAIGVHRASANLRRADRQRNCVAGVGVAAYTAGHLYRLVSLDVVDDVVGRDVVDCDGGAGCVRSDRMCCVGAVGAAGCVLAADRGGDGLTGHGAARHVDAVVAIGVHRASANLRRADRQRNCVAGVGVAAYTAGHLYRLVSLDVVDDVVGRDVVDCDGGAGCVRSDRMCCVGAVGAAGCVLAADRCRYRLTRHDAAEHANAVAAVGGHGARADLCRTDHQYDCVTGMGIAAHATCDLHGLTHLDIVDDVVCRNVVDRDGGAGGIAADAVGCADAVGAACGVRAADRGGDGLADQRAAQHTYAVVAIGIHRASAYLRRADHQRDCVALVRVTTDVAAHLYCLTRFDIVDDVVGGDAVDGDRGADRIDGNGDLSSGCSAGASDRIGSGHAGDDGVVGRDQVACLDIDAVTQCTSGARSD